MGCEERGLGKCPESPGVAARPARNIFEWLRQEWEQCGGGGREWFFRLV